MGVPVYNGAKFLGDALECLSQQDFGDFEVIVSDNGSTDSTPDIAAAYVAADRRFRYYREERNRGLPWNFNRSLELARAPLFTWNSADDRALPGHLGACVRALEADPQAMLAYAGVQLIDASGSVIGTKGESAEVAGPRPRDRVRGFLDGQLLQAIGWGGVLRTGVLRDFGGLPGYYGGDVTLGVVLAMRGRFVRAAGCSYQCRRHPDQATNLQTAELGRQLAAFDPDHVPTFAFPAWRLSASALAAVLAAPAPMPERLLSCAAFLQLWSARQWRAFPFDIKRNLRVLRARLTTAQ